MTTATAIAAALFGWIFWRQPSAGRVEWPREMPAFAEARAECAYETERSAFASFASAAAPNAALAEARTAFAADGWREEKIRTADMVVFTKGARTAAVLARPRGSGSLVTAIIRDGGK